MTRDEIKTIADIVGGDDTYRHFVHRINKEFDTADSDRNSRVKVLFEDENDEHVGFCVIGISPSKMRTWSEMFKDEGWVDGDFKIDPSSHELMYMYIKPEFRSKGLGKKLLRKAFTHAKDNNAKNIYAYVSDNSDYSLKFYKQMSANVVKDLSDEDISTAFVKWDL